MLHFFFSESSSSVLAKKYKLNILNQPIFHLYSLNKFKSLKLGL